MITLNDVVKELRAYMSSVTLPNGRPVPSLLGFRNKIDDRLLFNMFVKRFGNAVTFEHLTHAHGIGNNNDWEITLTNEDGWKKCIGHLFVLHGMYGEAAIYIYETDSKSPLASYDLNWTGVRRKV